MTLNGISWKVCVGEQYPFFDYPKDRLSANVRTMAVRFAKLIVQ